MDISIIVPVYNVEKYVRRCLDSLLEQTFKGEIEYIIVDDVSTDHSMDIVFQAITDHPQLNEHIRVVHQPRNMGLASARNRGMEYATGQYIIHCDSDDWVELDMIEKMYSRAISDNADIVTCDFYGSYDTKEIYYPQIVPFQSQEFFKKMLHGDAHYAPWNKLIKATLFKKLDFLWRDGVNMWEDVSIMPRLVYHANKISHVNSALYHYNQSNVNSYSNSWSDNAIQNVIEATGIITDFVTNLPESERFNADLKAFKGFAKFYILLRCKSDQLTEYESIFPEVTRCQISNIALPIWKKVIMHLFINKHYNLGRQLNAWVEFIKKMIR